MNYELVNCWLAERDIVLEKSFVYAIRKLAKEYKKAEIMYVTYILP